MVTDINPSLWRGSFHNGMRFPKRYPARGSVRHVPRRRRVNVDVDPDVLRVLRHEDDEVRVAVPLGQLAQVGVGDAPLSPRRRQFRKLVREVLADVADARVLVDLGLLAAKEPVGVLEVDGVDGELLLLRVVRRRLDQDVRVCGHAFPGEGELPLQDVGPEAVLVELERLGLDCAAVLLPASPVQKVIPEDIPAAFHIRADLAGFLI